MPKLLEKTRAARQADILRAAVTCFAQQGYYGTTMEEIAAEAGIAKGAAYIYFPSKEAIFLALYEACGCTLQEEILAALATLSSMGLVHVGGDPLAVPSDPQFLQFPRSGSKGTEELVRNFCRAVLDMCRRY